MSIEFRSHHYNYYNIEGRYSPKSPEKTGWIKQYEQTTDRIESSNSDPNNEKFKAFAKLEDIYYDKGVANRAKYRSYDELQQALSEKYLFGKEYKSYSETERRAMYENELNMTAFGHCSNFQDPRLGGPVYAETDEQAQAYNRQSVNNQIKNIFTNAGLDFSALSKNKLHFSIEPYDYKLSVSGTDDDTLKNTIEILLNGNRNSIELFTHLLASTRNSGNNISDDVMNKFRAIRDLKAVAGVDFRSFKQTSDGFFNSDGKSILDVYKDALETTTAVPKAFKGAAYDNFANTVSKLSSKNVSQIPDLVLDAYYIDGQLQDTINSSIISRTLNAKA